MFASSNSQWNSQDQQQTSFNPNTIPYPQFQPSTYGTKPHFNQIDSNYQSLPPPSLQNNHGQAYRSQQRHSNPPAQDGTILFYHKPEVNLPPLSSLVSLPNRENVFKQPQRPTLPSITALNTALPPIPPLQHNSPPKFNNPEPSFNPSYIQKPVERVQYPSIFSPQQEIEQMQFDSTFRRTSVVSSPSETVSASPISSFLPNTNGVNWQPTLPPVTPTFTPESSLSRRPQSYQANQSRTYALTQNQLDKPIIVESTDADVAGVPSFTLIQCRRPQSYQSNQSRTYVQEAPPPLHLEEQNPIAMDIPESAIPFEFQRTNDDEFLYIDPSTIQIQEDLTTASPTKYYLCPFCSHRFPNLGSIQMHLRTHSAQRLFPCHHKQCPARFARSHDLTRHLKTHSADRPFVCKLCGRGFARKDALKRHEKLIGMDGRIGCDGRRKGVLPNKRKRSGVDTMQESLVSLNLDQDKPAEQVEHEIIADP